MYLLFLDSEQAAIVRHSLAAARGFMQARLERADPDEIISRSLKLQDIKVEHVTRQLERTYVERQGDIAASVLEQIEAIANAAKGAKTQREKLAASRRVVDLVTAALRPE